MIFLCLAYFFVLPPRQNPFKSAIQAKYQSSKSFIPEFLLSSPTPFPPKLTTGKEQ